MTILILFFWFIISNLFINIVVNKASLIKNNINYSLLTNGNNNDIIELLQTNLSDPYEKQVLKNKSDISYNARMNYNVNLLFSDIGPFFYTIVIIILLNLYIIYYLSIRFKKTDFVLFFMVFFSFSCELLLFFQVASKWQFIGDQYIIKLLLT
jgi:hypothetical protein